MVIILFSVTTEVVQRQQRSINQTILEHITTSS